MFPLHFLIDSFDTNEDTTVRYRFKVENECGETDWAEVKIKVKGLKVSVVIYYIEQRRNVVLVRKRIAV